MSKTRFWHSNPLHDALAGGNETRQLLQGRPPDAYGQMAGQVPITAGVLTTSDLGSSFEGYNQDNPTYTGRRAYTNRLGYSMAVDFLRRGAGDNLTLQITIAIPDFQANRTGIRAAETALRSAVNPNRVLVVIDGNRYEMLHAAHSQGDRFWRFIQASGVDNNVLGVPGSTHDVAIYLLPEPDVLPGVPQLGGFNYYDILEPETPDGFTDVAAGSGSELYTAAADFLGGTRLNRWGVAQGATAEPYLPQSFRAAADTGNFERGDFRIRSPADSVLQDALLPQAFRFASVTNLAGAAGEIGVYNIDPAVSADVFLLLENTGSTPVTAVFAAAGAAYDVDFAGGGGTIYTWAAGETAAVYLTADAFPAQLSIGGYSGFTLDSGSGLYRKDYATEAVSYQVKYLHWGPRLDMTEAPLQSGYAPPRLANLRQMTTSHNRRGEYLGAVSYAISGRTDMRFATVPQQWARDNWAPLRSHVNAGIPFFVDGLGSGEFSRAVADGPVSEVAYSSPGHVNLALRLKYLPGEITAAVPFSGALP